MNIMHRSHKVGRMPFVEHRQPLESIQIDMLSGRDDQADYNGSASYFPRFE
jgi:hypothetical protein